ncbi:MAG: flagellar hook-length control protein FliK [Gammaproteobacteria bacterium]|nr:flagellar hook-length control protein FliK [Gammaproteobacteria bacterium]
MANSTAAILFSQAASAKQPLSATLSGQKTVPMSEQGASNRSHSFAALLNQHSRPGKESAVPADESLAADIESQSTDLKQTDLLKKLGSLKDLLSDTNGEGLESLLEQLPTLSDDETALTLLLQTDLASLQEQGIIKAEDLDALVQWLTQFDSEKLSPELRKLVDSEQSSELNLSQLRQALRQLIVNMDDLIKENKTASVEDSVLTKLDSSSDNLKNEFAERILQVRQIFQQGSEQQQGTEPGKEELNQFLQKAIQQGIALEKILDGEAFAEVLDELKQFQTLMGDKGVDGINRAQQVSDALEQLADRISPQGLERSVNVANTSAVRSTPNLSLSTPIHNPDWQQGFAQRIAIVVQNQLQQADIRLNPPELGAINIRLNINQDQANVVFSSPHGVVRDAIEAAIPRLRDMLNEQGLNLANVDVSAQTPQKQHQEYTASQNSGAKNGDEFGKASWSNTEADEVKPRHYSSRGLVDFYA